MKCQAIPAILQISPGCSSRMVYLLRNMRRPLAVPPGSWSPGGNAEVLLQEDAPTEGKGTPIPRAEEGFLPAFNTRLQPGTLEGTMLLSVVRETGARAVSAFMAIACLSTP